MKVWTSDRLAVSRAGHDRGLLYVVLSEEGGYLMLTDGKHHTLDHPKKKKCMHVQAITHLPQDLLAAMRKITTDADVRRIIRSYQTLQSR